MLPKSTDKKNKILINKKRKESYSWWGSIRTSGKGPGYGDLHFPLQGGARERRWVLGTQEGRHYPIEKKGVPLFGPFSSQAVKTGKRPRNYHLKRVAKRFSQEAFFLTGKQTQRSLKPLWSHGKKSPTPLPIGLSTKKNPRKRRRSYTA